MEEQKIVLSLLVAYLECASSSAGKSNVKNSRRLLSSSCDYCSSTVATAAKSSRVLRVACSSATTATSSRPVLRVAPLLTLLQLLSCYAPSRSLVLVSGASGRHQSLLYTARSEQQPVIAAEAPLKNALNQTCGIFPPPTVQCPCQRQIKGISLAASFRMTKKVIDRKSVTVYFLLSANALQSSKVSENFGPSCVAYVLFISWVDS